MALTRTDYLYRLRILFAADGALQTVETVGRTLIAEDGVVHADKDADVRTFDVAKVSRPVIDALLAELVRVGAEMESEAAAAKAADAKDAEVAEAKRVSREAFERMAQGALKA